MSSFEKNLSEGNVAKQLILFSLPFLASNIIQSLYSVADMLIVGRFSGTTSMSGVNLGSQVTLILTNIVVGVCRRNGIDRAVFGSQKAEGYAGDNSHITDHINNGSHCYHSFNADLEKADSSSDSDTGGIFCGG